jgi:phospholipid/cholesterol/gamma-HCH transport system ATP-binding protein
MNSVMGIGEYVMFLYKGKKLWEGDSNNIVETTVPELKEFLFANQFIKHMKENEANG